MFQIASTPEPPYYAVIAPAVLRPRLKGYGETALHLIGKAPEIDGFLGIETCVTADFSLAVSYWRSLDAIAAWRQHPDHVAAKEQARSQWFAAYRTRIARVERVY